MTQKNFSMQMDDALLDRLRSVSSDYGISMTNIVTSGVAKELNRIVRESKPLWGKDAVLIYRTQKGADNEPTV
jgi:hypothetical protein